MAASRLPNMRIRRRIFIVSLVISTPRKVAAPQDPLPI